MRTVVISDLHLGGSIGVDILRRPENREILKSVIAGCDRLVLLGDTLELRHGPVHGVLDTALPALSDIASALDPGTEVVLVPGNHDHAVISPWLDSRRREGVPAPLGVADVAAAESGPIASRIAAAMQPARVVLSHPGVFIRGDVYAFHGNYLDRHIEIPTVERLSAGAMEKITGRPASQADGADDYEAVLGPMYAWSFEVAQSAGSRAGLGAHGLSQRAWGMLSGGGHRPVRRKLAGLGFAGVVGVLNAARIGPLRADISPVRLREAGLEAARAAASGLGIGAAHLIFGHTHRPGPLPGDDASGWTLDGMRLWNTGSWVFEQHFLAAAPPGSPYWPGRAIEVRESGDPVVISAMDHLSAAEILGPMFPEDDVD